MFPLDFYQMVKPWCQLALRHDHPELGNVQVTSGKHWKFRWALCRRLTPKNGLGKGEVSSNGKPEHKDITKFICRNLQCTVNFSFLCEEQTVTYKSPRKVCIWQFFLSAEAKGKWPTRSHKCNLDPSLFICLWSNCYQAAGFLLACAKMSSDVLHFKFGVHYYNQCARISSSMIWAAASQKRSILS